MSVASTAGLKDRLFDSPVLLGSNRSADNINDVVMVKK